MARINETFLKAWTAFWTNQEDRSHHSRGASVPDLAGCGSVHLDDLRNGDQ